MDTRQIDNFLVLYRTRNLHRASERLYISQQGLSRSIQSLETELEVMLFERSHAGMAPTAAGDYFYERMLAMKAELDAVRRDVRSVATDGIRVDLPCSYGILHGAFEVITCFAEQYPQVQIRWEELTDRAVERTILDGNHEFGLCVRNSDPTGLEFVPLFSRHKVLLLPDDHPLATASSITYTDLRDEPIALEGPEFNANKRFLQGCVESGFYPNIVAETAEITLCLKLAQERRALAVVPDFIASMGNDSSIVAVPFADEGFTWEAGAVYRKGERPEGILAELLNYLVEHACDMS